LLAQFRQYQLGDKLRRHFLREPNASTMPIDVKLSDIFSCLSQVGFTLQFETTGRLRIITNRSPYRDI
jgi:hypothetical protein